MRHIGHIRRAGQQSQGGFSLIEVLIALVILAIGLLGLALLQTMNLRYTKSAEQRTKAVNLASAILDTMRTNRSEVAAYVVDDADFADVDPVGGCSRDAALDAASNIARWMCEVKEALGPEATGAIVVAGSTVRVQLRWSEDNLPLLADGAEITLETVL
ncbi:type IV pilus modification protein PilV [Luteimonas sp. MC1572]|uniref:type IV pilus modification protein PilV n=1 Tax=Luteimonas sp. MC1572 TaxID=2799325 RepID=UPI0018F0E891|nr:type IV pilus modification protein PilV [Luteimonas sp. MC1572]MBJ6982624.1 type IV pilus modification protein PilV [Luteimonas sp. MC1572]QQO03870.1 type IV pilus modification protein PilV [Luteimonas sp. MC1572]